LDDKEYRGNLLQQFTQACDFLQKHLNFGRVIERGGSSEQPEFPFWILEEALANALIHREYVTEPDHTPRAEAVMVEIFPDRIEISSPGGPPADMHITVLQKASEQHPGSQPRNPQIMRIFYLAGYVERIGAGLEGIQERMQEAGLPQPVIHLDEQTQTFSIILHRPSTLTTPEEVVLSEPRHAEEATNTHRPALSVLQRSSWFRRPYHFVLTLLAIILVFVLVFRGNIRSYLAVIHLFASGKVTRNGSSTNNTRDSYDRTTCQHLCCIQCL
jgi:ATP-dependent DNA helicase RecG